jgi:hypothetical protein
METKDKKRKRDKTVNRTLPTIIFLQRFLCSLHLRKMNIGSRYLTYVTNFECLNTAYRTSFEVQGSYVQHSEIYVLKSGQTEERHHIYKYIQHIAYFQFSVNRKHDKRCELFTIIFTTVQATPLRPVAF